MFVVTWALFVNVLGSNAKLISRQNYVTKLKKEPCKQVTRSAIWGLNTYFPEIHIKPFYYNFFRYASQSNMSYIYF